MMNKNKKVLTFFEYDIQRIENLNTYNKLQKISEDLKLNFHFLSNQRIKSSQYVGVLEVDNLIIQVLPKVFGKYENLKENKKFIFSNLLYMLSYTNKLNIKETEISNLAKSDNLYEIIIYLFSKNLLNLIRKDLNKSYVLEEDNLNFLKGKLLFNTHIRKNLFNKAKFHCEYDEFTEDNLLNQILKGAVLKCLKNTQFKRSFKYLSICDLILNEVSIRKRVIPSDCNKIKFTRLNSKFENVFNLAKLILFGDSINLNSNSLKSFSFMFDMNKLFEEFVFNILKKSNSNYLIRAENPRKNIFENFFQMKPDITIYDLDNKTCKLIIDTKYKLVEKDKSKFGVSQQDVYQMFTYSKYYDVPEITLVYPKYEHFFENKSFNTKKDLGFNFKLNIKTIDLHKNLLNKDERKEVFKQITDLI